MELFVFGDLDRFEVLVSGRVDAADHAALSRTISTLPGDTPMLVELRDVHRQEASAAEAQIEHAAHARTAPTEIRRTVVNGVRDLS